LKQELTLTDTAAQNIMQAKESLYDRYGGMLLGYIYNIVKNNAVAEQYLVELFAKLKPAEITELYKPGCNTFCKLQLMARKTLSEFFGKRGATTADGSKPVVNVFTSLMNAEQQQIFCGIYYQGKTTAVLAAELGKPEAKVRQILKESFNLIRRKPL